MESTVTKIDGEEIVDVEAPFEMVNGIEGSSLLHQEYLNDKEDSNSLPEEIVGKPPEIDYDSIGEFCFESDELALKGNSDYKNILEAMVVLEAQKTKAVKDLELLKKLENEALADPFAFLERFRRKEKINFPTPQQIYPIPIIDWSKYVISGNPSAFCRRQLALTSERMDQFRSNAITGDLSNENILFQRPWTLEEEKKLQDLLSEFPETMCSSERWRKVASFLPNRTPSEVEKKEQLILGLENGKNILETLKRKDGDREDGDMDLMDDGISLDLKSTPEYQELVLLKRVLRKKLDSTSLSCHTGFKCCRCSMEPIVGVRWHCTDCRPPFSTDFCNDCKDSSFENRVHKMNHKVERIHVSKALLDRDYMQFLGDYNYLDPNYMPAT